MAIATEVTISTGNKVTFNYQSREVGVSLTYQLEREDTDVLELVREKAGEVARAHQAIWQKMRDEKAAHKRSASRNGHAAAKRSAVTANGAKPYEDSPSIAQAIDSLEADKREDESEEETPHVPSSAAQRRALIALFNASPLTDDEFETLLRERFGWTTVDELSHPQASRLLVELQRKERERLARERSERNGK